jgi:hypothetical protein
MSLSVNINEKAKNAVLKKAGEIKNPQVWEIQLCKLSGYPFYNTSKYTFTRPVDDPDHIEANFRGYLNGFSAFEEIIRRFSEAHNHNGSPLFSGDAGSGPSVETALGEVFE